MTISLSVVLIINKLNESYKKDLFSANYEKLIRYGDFNVEANESSVKACCKICGLKRLNEQSTCYKNTSNPRCTDLIQTDVP